MRDPMRGTKIQRRAAGFAALGLGLVLGLATCGSPELRLRFDRRTREPLLRVGLVVGVPDLRVHLQGRYLLRGRAGTATLADEDVRAFRDTEQLVLMTTAGSEHRARRSLRLVPLDADAVARVGEDAYPGTLILLRVGDHLNLVNEVGLETYLRGVVPWEIGWRDASHAAAVEAQAIAARTYACKRFGQYPDEGFDVYADVRDQVYRGTTRRDSTADRAIAATAGQVLRSAPHGPLAETYYCSTCGGHTSRVDAVWPDKPPAAYLRGIRDAAPSDSVSFCAVSPHFRWTEAWSGAELERVVRETLPGEVGLLPGTDVGSLIDLRLVGRQASGRADVLEVVTTRGTYRVRGDRMRWVLRPRGRRILRSTLIDLERERRDGHLVRIVVRGGGNGHGVGMCQIGALEMARRGYSAPAILEHYYPSTVVVQLYGDPERMSSDGGR